MFSLFDKHQRNTVQAVDQIESIVYEALKPYGFRKHGRTLHRFVDGDISQVIHFQSGLPSMGKRNLMCVNLGIRVPESFERTFTVKEPPRRYYHEYECNIRSRLSMLCDGQDIWYDLEKNPQTIGHDILEKLKHNALPIFNTLNSRDAILAHRADYPAFDDNRDLIKLEESMIYGRRGEVSKAISLFQAYYAEALASYNHKLEHGTQIYLRKGESVIYRNEKTEKTETVFAEKNGYVTLYDANCAHLDYLKRLAQTLNIPLE